jgi:hypothetical protein
MDIWKVADGNSMAKAQLFVVYIPENHDFLIDIHFMSISRSSMLVDVAFCFLLHNIWTGCIGLTNLIDICLKVLN